jgi:hypothetical protein
MYVPQAFGALDLTERLLAHPIVVDQAGTNRTRVAQW